MTMVREDIVERTLRWMTENLMGKEWKEWGQILRSGVKSLSLTLSEIVEEIEPEPGLAFKHFQKHNGRRHNLWRHP
jgi:hypothetical protein